MNAAELDGRIGEGWGGLGANGTHVNVVLAQRSSPTFAAAVGMFAHPSPGHTPILVCVGPAQTSYEPIWPPTLMMNKATATDARHETITWGAAQLGIGQGVLDAVADGLLETSGEIEVGYNLSEKFWRQGLGYECAVAWLKFGFETAGLDRIVAVAHPDNTGSWRIMEKCGMRFRGNEEHYGFDCVVYEITREEFLDRHAN